MQEAPVIRSNYEMKRSYIPLTERQPQDNFDDKLENKRKANRNFSQEAEDIQKCTFGPKTNRTSKDLNRSVEDLLEWNDKKNMDLQNKRLKGQNGLPQYKFEPQLNKNSLEIMQNKKIDYLQTRPEDRLIQRGEELKKQKDLMRQSSTQGWFKPHITQKSKELILIKQGKLPAETKVKAKNLGEVGNVTYFDASENPRTSKSTNQKDKHNTKVKKSKDKETVNLNVNVVKSRQDHAVEQQKERIKTARDQRDKINNPQFKKIMDPLPEYKSPYNKDFVQSEIPLKKLLDKNTQKKLKDAGRAQKQLRPGQTDLRQNKINKILQSSTTKSQTRKKKDASSAAVISGLSKKEKKEEYDPASYKSNPYRTKAEWEEYSRKQEQNQLITGKKDHVKSNKEKIKYLENKKKQDIARKAKADLLN